MFQRKLLFLLVLLIPLALAAAPFIYINHPTGIINYSSSGSTLDLNWSIDLGVADSCWYEYNGINTTTNCRGWIGASKIENSKQILINSAPRTDRFGIQINVTQNVTISNIEKVTDVNANTCHVYSGDGETLLIEATFSGNNCALPDYFLQENTNYTLLISSNGSSYNHYRTDGATFPIANTYSNVLGGVVSNKTMDYTQAHNVQNYTLRPTGSESTTFTVTDYNNRTIIFYSNDSSNNVNSTTTTWDYRLWENSITYNASTISTFTESYIINLTYNSSDYDTASAVFYYNNTPYAISNSGSGDELIFSRTITTPAITAEANKTFFWEISLVNGTATDKFNSTTSNQTVSAINISLCGNPYTVLFLNFTVYDEADLSIQTAQFSGGFTWGGTSLSNTYNYQDTAEDEESFEFCFNPADRTYRFTGDVEIVAGGFVTETYSLQELSLSNISTNIPIYLLNESDSTSFIVHVRDTAYADVANAIVEIQRYYPGTNQWLTVESIKTNIDGKSIGHFVTEDVDYRFKVYVDSTLVYTSLSTKVFAESTPATIILTIPSTSITTGFENYEAIPNLESSLTYTKLTNIVSYTWADSADNANGSRLIVIRYHYGSGVTETICDSISTEITGGLTCDLSGEVNGTYIATAYNLRTGETPRIDRAIVFQKAPDVVSEIGEDGLLITVFILMGIIVIGIYSPGIAIFLCLGSLIAFSLLGIVSIPVIFLFSVITIGFIILWGYRR